MQPARASTVIDVAMVDRAASALPEVSARFGVEALLTAPPSHFPEWGPRPEPAQPRPAVEAWSNRNDVVAGVSFHPVVAAIHRAFSGHRPLVLSPDIIWLLIAQGFAHHINANAKTHRSALVSHQGRVCISVRRDDFVKGSADNPWPEVFDEFTTRIREHIGPETHDLLLPAFSTTGPTERAATQVVLLDAVQSYFSFEMSTVCGIPQIVLEGTAADWQTVADRTREFGRFGLQWWTEPLADVLAEFLAAARGKVRADFWQSIYKLGGGSGGPYTTGWITAFFPYLVDPRTGRATRPNPKLAYGDAAAVQALLRPGDDEVRFRGPTIDQFPGGLARAPFSWEYLGQRVEMEFLGGFVGVRQDADTLRLTPEVGWAIREAVEGDERSDAFDDLEFDRSGEGRRVAELKAAGLWTERGMCPRCGTWLYRYGSAPLGSHCGGPLVNVRSREEDDNLDEDQRRKRSSDRFRFSSRHVIEFARSIFSGGGRRR